MTRVNTELEVIALSMVIAALGICGLYLASTVMIPLVVAIFTAVLVAPVQSALEHQGIPRALSVLAALLVVALFLAALSLLCAEAISMVVAKSDTYVSQAEAAALELAGRLRAATGLEPSQWLPGEDASSGRRIMNRVSGWLGTLNTFLTGLLFTFLFLVFLLSSRGRISTKVKELTQEAGNDRDQSDSILGALERQIRDYLWLKILVSVPVGIVFGGTAALLGLDFALAWGMLAFALNFIPSLGPLLATAPAVLVAFLQFELGWALLTASLFGLIQFVAGSVVEPLVMKNRLGLNFIAVIASIFLWGLVWKFPGLILGVPLTACLNTALARSRHFQNVSRLLSP